MTRSGYSYDDEFNTLGLWRNAVALSIKGNRGQAFLRELLATLDAMPVKRLIPNSFQETSGEVCALGSVGAKRGTDMSKFIDGWGEGDRDVISAAFDIAPALAAEIMFINDEGDWRGQETDEERFERVRAWVAAKIAKVTP